MSSDDETRLSAAQRGLTAVGMALADVVAGLLEPALSDQRVPSCLHLLGDIEPGDLPVGGEYAIGDGHRALICPMHPERLLCTQPECIRQHLADGHVNGQDEPRCFVCEAPWDDPLTGLRDDFDGVTATVQLHRAVPICVDSRAPGQWYVIRGEIGVLPVAYLCGRHDDLIITPIKMAWPTNADNVRPEDVIGGGAP